tara:strand:+ start:157 stop:387 length:231 start_codon:yes stop_codon:yes gene_type:complete
MWGYKCYLCGTDTNDYLCEDCKQIKRIADLYGIDVVRKSCDEIFVRDAEPITKRTEVVAKKIVTRSQTKDDKKSSN